MVPGGPKGPSPASPQGSWGPKRPRPASPQGTRGEDWTWTGLVLRVHCAYQLSSYRYLVCIYSGDFQPEVFSAQKCAESGLVLVFICLFFFTKKIKVNVLNIMYLCVEYDKSMP